MERVIKGLWKVLDDQPERGRQYDAQRLSGVAVELKSHLPIERQAGVIGATWLDPRLVGGGKGLGELGFGSKAKQALLQRADFLKNCHRNRVGASPRWWMASMWPASTGAALCWPVSTMRCWTMAWDSAWYRGSQ